MNRVKELRKSKMMNQQQLADALGVCKDYVGIIERGKQTPGFKLANEIADFFGVSVDYLNFFKNSSNNSFGDSCQGTM